MHQKANIVQLSIKDKVFKLCTKSKNYLETIAVVEHMLNQIMSYSH